MTVYACAIKTGRIIAGYTIYAGTRKYWFDASLQPVAIRPDGEEDDGLPFEETAQLINDILTKHFIPAR